MVRGGNGRQAAAQRSELQQDARDTLGCMVDEHYKGLEWMYREMEGGKDMVLELSNLAFDIRHEHLNAMVSSAVQKLAEIYCIC